MQQGEGSALQHSDENEEQLLEINRERRKQCDKKQKEGQAARKLRSDGH